MRLTLIKNTTIVNEGSKTLSDVLIKDSRIEKIGQNISHPEATIVDASGCLLFPGIIDDQVHFREPGMTHKADIESESIAAVAGGVTSFMEMPNTSPPATSLERLEEKYARAAQVSPANYSFYMGADNENLDEVLRADPKNVCGIKVFMGSSTGNMLVDNPNTLEQLFSKCSMLIATHCESEEIIRENTRKAIEKYGDNIPAWEHPNIRSVEACLQSSTFAVNLAKKHGTRLHVLHISTAEETELFERDIPLEKKKITAEVCVHHLTFHAGEYAKLGHQIKCNPAIKEIRHRDALWKALIAGRLDVIATDHAPHTAREKRNDYTKSPSGLPLVQHSLGLMLLHWHASKITPELIVQKMCHNPALLFNITDRGFIREGYKADLVLVNPYIRWSVNSRNILYKCDWSPLEGRNFKGGAIKTWVNGQLVWNEGKYTGAKAGERLLFGA